MRTRQAVSLGIVTYHNGFNFGAFLQAYALQRTLAELGIQSEIINYKGWKHSYWEYRCLFFTRRPTILFGNFLKMLAFFRAHKRLRLSSAVSDVKKLSICSYACVIFGSDEIWNYLNPIIGLDPTYFGVGVSATRRIAYAVSCGSVPKNSVVPELISRAWQNFDSIAVRDENSKEIVSKYVDAAVEIVLDPTFLIDFHGEEIECTKNNFILVYTTGFSPEVQQAVREYATLAGKRLISIGYYNAFCDENIIGMGPFDFLGYYKAACVVITSMFHGVIFGIKYNKQLAIIVDPYRTNKLATILKYFDISDRITGAEDLRSTLSKPMDYVRVNQLVAVGVSNSMSYLQEACVGGSGNANSL
jgi:hypothetical protein